MCAVLGRPVRRMSALATLPRWNAAAHLATVLYERTRLPKDFESSEGHSFAVLPRNTAIFT